MNFRDPAAVYMCGPAFSTWTISFQPAAPACSRPHSKSGLSIVLWEWLLSNLHSLVRTGITCTPVKFQTIVVLSRGHRTVTCDLLRTLQRCAKLFITDSGALQITTVRVHQGHFLNVSRKALDRAKMTSNRHDGDLTSLLWTTVGGRCLAFPQGMPPSASGSGAFEIPLRRGLR
jgi:hypothetical protein